jgi:hypothetical protein
LPLIWKDAMQSFEIWKKPSKCKLLRLTQLAS